MPKKRDDNSPYWIAMQTFEKQLILDYLRRTEGNMTAAAELLGLPITTTYYRCRVLGIPLQSKRQALLEPASPTPTPQAPQSPPEAPNDPEAQ